MKYRETKNGYFLKVEKGEEIVQTLLDFIAKLKIPSGTISGIGALENVELGYFNTETKEYRHSDFDGVFELLSLAGNIAWLDGKPVAHVHCMIGDANYNVKGGHLFSGIVAVTGEIYMQTFTDKFTRAKDPELELNLLDF